MKELTIESINEALAAGAKNFTAIYRHVSGNPDAKAPGGFANRVRKLVPGIFSSPSVESVESLETVDATTISENPQGATISPEVETTPTPCLLCGKTVNVENSMIPKDTGWAVTCRECSDRMDEQEAEERRVKAEQDRIAAMPPGPARTKARADLKWGPAHACPTCRGTRFRTVSKSLHVYRCRACGCAVEAKPGDPSKTLGKDWTLPVEAIA